MPSLSSSNPLPPSTAEQPPHKKVKFSNEVDEKTVERYLAVAQPFSTAASANPLQLKPLGNLLFHPEYRRTRHEGLGRLARLPDELLLSPVFSLFEGEELIKMAGTSKAFFAWTCVEGMWKGLYIAKTQGRLLRWYGSWRASYIATFLRPAIVPANEPLPFQSISTPQLHSDVLFQPALCAAFDPRSLFRTSAFVPSIARLPGRDLAPSDLPNEPVILTGLADDWPALSSDPARRWTLSDLTKRFPSQLFRAEATLTTLNDYTTYHDGCEQDESPLYLFESEFVRKTEGEEGNPSFGDDYEVARCFSEDLFSVMNEERPDYRWLIVGPSRSGSTWHCDPNHTSAWNTVLTGSKAWVMFPPEITPPGVYASEDGAQVEAPLSLAEWFISYYKSAKAMYGSKAKDLANRGKMREGICGVGETVYVPSGWWHIVVNLAPSIAVTQNFVSERELPAVLAFMQNRPEQVSGFKLHTTGNNDGAEGGLDECDETGAGVVLDKFVEALKRSGRGEMVEKALQAVKRSAVQPAVEVEALEKKVEGGMWSKVKEEQEESGAGGGFSFGFGMEGDDFELDDDLLL